MTQSLTKHIANSIQHLLPYLRLMKNTTVCILLYLVVLACTKDNTGTSINNQPETDPPVQKAVTVAVNANIGGYLEALPARYDSTTKKYPLLLCLHGVGELGNGDADLSKVAKNGTPTLIKNQKFPASFEVNGTSYSFIVLSPQFKNWPWPVDVNDMVNWAIAHYRVDTTRMYISGLSMGGGITWEYAAIYPGRIAAIAPICGASAPSDGKAKSMADAHLPVWAFHNKNDSTVTYQYSTGYVEKLNAAGADPAAILTLWPTGGHNAWTKATDPNYKEGGKNIYEWMLQYHR